jgi:hypothetical protein
LAHLVALVITVLLLCTMPFLVTEMERNDLRRLWREITQSHEAQLFIVGAFLLIEAVFLCTALLLMPWAAHDEPMGQTWRHALRTAWLGTGCMIPCTVLFLMAMLSKEPIFEGPRLGVFFELLLAWVAFFMLCALAHLMVGLEGIRRTRYANV